VYISSAVLLLHHRPLITYVYARV